MKYILKFNSYLIKEADELNNVNGVETPNDTETTSSNIDSSETEENPEIQKRNSAVVLKEFLEELRGHLIYWFKYGEISKILLAENSDITTERRGLCIWADDINEEYVWKIKFLESEIMGKIQQVKDLLLTIDVYDFDKEYIIKRKEIVIPIKDMNEDYLIKSVKEIRNAILKEPVKSVDIKKFKDNEEESLTDNIY